MTVSGTQFVEVRVYWHSLWEPGSRYWSSLYAGGLVDTKTNVLPQCLSGHSMLSAFPIKKHNLVGEIPNWPEEEEKLVVPDNSVSQRFSL